MQWQAAAEGPPSLVAIFPMVASTSLHHNSFDHGGVFQPARAAGWVPTLGGNDCCGAPIPIGLIDQRPVEARSDVLVYTSEILREPVAVAGPVKAKFYISTDAPDTDLSVKLEDVHPNGFATNIAEGILRARFRKGFDRMEPLKPGEVYQLEADMCGTANVLLPGHRMRVDVTSSNFPQFDRNPNTGEDLGASTRRRPARQTVSLSARHHRASSCPWWRRRRRGLRRPAQS